MTQDALDSQINQALWQLAEEVEKATFPTDKEWKLRLFIWLTDGQLSMEDNLLKSLEPDLLKC